MPNQNSTTEWLVEKINRKLEMFLKTKDADYLLKAQVCLKDLMNEHDLERTWGTYYQKWVKNWNKYKEL